MGLYLKQEEPRTELQRRINSELKRKAEASADVGLFDETDKIVDEESKLKESDGSFGKIALLIGVALVIIIGYLVATT